MAEQQPTASPLSAEQRKTLNVLGYLFLRMGQFERAGRVFSALLALDPKDRWARRNLAAIAVQAGDGAAALAHLQEGLEPGALSSRDAALHLIRARALWLEGRREEARNAVHEFIHLAGREE